MLSFRGTQRKKPIPKIVASRVAVQEVPVQATSPPPVLDLALALNSSLKATLANSLKDNCELRDKLVQAKSDLKAARELNLKRADYNEWRSKALLGYEAGCNAGSKQVHFFEKCCRH